MKRILTAVLAALMVSSAAIATVSAGEKVEGRKTAEAYVATDITVDGKIEDAWKYANSYKVDQVKGYSKDWYKDTMKTGVDYASMTVKVLWDGKATLYILAEVSDKTPNYVADSSWLRDSIDLFFRMDNTNAAGNKRDFQPRVQADGSNATTVKNLLKTVVTINKDSWIMETAVDVTKAGGAGKYLGIDFQYNDNVLGKKAREVCLGWSDKEDKASSDATVLGQCLLSTKKVADIKAAQTTAATTKAPAAKPTAPATFDAAVVLAVVASMAGAGVVVSKKRK